FIVNTSIKNIRTPHEPPENFTLFVLLLVILVKEILYRYSRRVGDEIDSTALKAEAFHHRSDSLTSVAAFIGIFLAIIGGPGYESADDWAALIAAGFVCFN